MPKQKYFLEWHGCSMSKSEAEMIAAFLEANNFSETKKPKKSDLIILSACGVKDATEYRMLKRIRELNKFAEKKPSIFVVFGCLSKISPKKILEISNKIILCGPKLSELAEKLSLPLRDFSPCLPVKRSNKFISIIPVSEGCLSKCSYCATVNARGKLKSHSIEEIKKAFDESVSKTKEIWLTSQDMSAYGIDLKTNLALLVKTLLKAEGTYRVRIGMMNPLHLKKFFPAYMKLFSDERLYRFFHIPVQSGSDEILKKMNRGYTSKEFISLCKKIRKKFPDATISTDIIVGFPSETEKDFSDTIELLESIRPGVVNISRYAARPGTAASKMPFQLSGSEKKKRSRILSKLCKKYSFEANKKLLKSRQLVLVSETGRKGNFIARTLNYRPVAVKKDLRGKFVLVEITKAFVSYVECGIEKVF